MNWHEPNGIIFRGRSGIAIPRTMQLVAGRTGQEYNQRQQRKGAFWEDRYHATAVESGDHLARAVWFTSIPTRYGPVWLPSPTNRPTAAIMRSRKPAGRR